MRVDEITSSDWSTSISTPGEVVTDLEDIKQCLYILLMTRKGSAPFRPFFGCDWFDRLDQPVNSAAPAIVNDVREAIRKWETRIILDNIIYSFPDPNKSVMHVEILWHPVNGTKLGQENSVTFGIKGGVIYLVNEFNQYFNTEFGIISI